MKKYERLKQPRTRNLTSSLRNLSVGSLGIHPIVMKGFDEKDYITLAEEKKLKLEQTEREFREKKVHELEDFLMSQEIDLTKFVKELFRRFVEKVNVRSMVEVELAFKAGFEVREVLG